MSCGCGQSTCAECSCSATATPYYQNTNNAIQEEHCVPTTIKEFATAIATSSISAMPACNKIAILSFPGLFQMLVGSYLWNPAYGFLKVIAVDTLTCQVTIKNECIPGNATPGKVIPRCTLFNVTVPPCSCPSGVT